LISQGIGAFRGRRVLLLQGPVGPFFARLAADLRQLGAVVHKVNFNAGDWIFYRDDAVNYRGTLQDWPEWLARHLGEWRIEVILLFGDCRPIHQRAHEIAAKLGIEIGVFEEGYVRPDFITLERFGVNGYSKLPRSPSHYEHPREPTPTWPVGKTYWPMVRHAALYFLMAWLGQWLFPNYRHHRPIKAAALWPWVRSALRKVLYRWSERSMQSQLTRELHGHYFLAPLQVFDDAQVRVHGAVEDIEDFVRETARSFAANAPANTLLVFKHHPMDRGHRDYGALIERLAVAWRVEGRVLYIHDQHLPTLLQHARGVVVINSTTGISALHHGRPTFVRGIAMYDMPGLTWQGELDGCWANAPLQAPDAALFGRYLQHLLAATQINGSFYKPLAQSPMACGLNWPELTQAPASAESATPPAHAPAKPVAARVEA
jgi:capsular polysaccharide export protein